MLNIRFECCYKNICMLIVLKTYTSFTINDFTFTCIFVTYNIEISSSNPVSQHLPPTWNLSCILLGQHSSKSLFLKNDFSTCYMKGSRSKFFLIKIQENQTFANPLMSKCVLLSNEKLRTPNIVQCLLLSKEHVVTASYGQML